MFENKTEKVTNLIEPLRESSPIFPKYVIELSIIEKMPIFY